MNRSLGTNWVHIAPLYLRTLKKQIENVLLWNIDRDTRYSWYKGDEYKPWDKLNAHYTDISKNIEKTNRKCLAVEYRKRCTIAPYKLEVFFRKS